MSKSGGSEDSYKDDELSDEDESQYSEKGNGGVGMGLSRMQV